MVGQEQGCLQDRGFGDRGPIVGPEKEPTGNELRQVVAVDSAVLQEGNHEEDGTITATGLSVLSSVLLVIY